MASAKAVVFYDESRELKEAIGKNEGRKGVEVVTTRALPFEVHSRLMKLLSPYLNNCGDCDCRPRGRPSREKEKTQALFIFLRGRLFFFWENLRPPRGLLAW